MSKQTFICRNIDQYTSEAVTHIVLTLSDKTAFHFKAEKLQANLYLPGLMYSPFFGEIKLEADEMYVESYAGVKVLDDDVEEQDVVELPPSVRFPERTLVRLECAAIAVHARGVVRFRALLKNGDGIVETESLMPLKEYRVVDLDTKDWVPL